MATVTDVEVANASFPTVRQDLNDILEAIATNFSADAEPSTTYANQWWYETDTNKLYIRNEDNDAWIHVLTLDQTGNTVSGVEGAGGDKIEEGNSSIEVIDTGTGYIQINVDGAEAGRFDSSGNLLMGHTGTNIYADATGQGITVNKNGRFDVKRDDVQAIFNRTSYSSGGAAVIQFRKNGTTAGSIDVNAGGVQFDCNGTVKLNSSGLTFDNGSNYLDDYEEGTWSPTVTPGSGSITLNTSYDTAAYTKIGRVVTLQGELRISSVSSPQGNVQITNLPFALASLPENSERPSGSVFIYNAGGTPYYKTCATQLSGSAFNLLCYPSGTYNDSVFQHTFEASDELVFSVTYFTDA